MSTGTHDIPETLETLETVSHTDSKLFDTPDTPDTLDTLGFQKALILYLFIRAPANE
jgi:hypothetical protein